MYVCDAYVVTANNLDNNQTCWLLWSDCDFTCGSLASVYLVRHLFSTPGKTFSNLDKLINLNTFEHIEQLGTRLFGLARVHCTNHAARCCTLHSIYTSRVLLATVSFPLNILDTGTTDTEFLLSWKISKYVCTCISSQAKDIVLNLVTLSYQHK